ncbi:hypothetical protein AMTR_s00057p00060100 [Amborella trichopoda]|uniref:Uncharacterized protein n=1 Tax=Amborella trichopoda TaxID=13333 RepID=U5CU01_AMBTC|nr:hypothetical protein AMTR_s00057p00060100 [Amborella trichopoda]
MSTINSINLDYIFHIDLADEWVSQKVPILDPVFLEISVADMNDNYEILAINEGNMVEAVEDMEEDDDDFNEVNNDEGGDDDGVLQYDWREPTIIECEVLQVIRTSTEEEEGLRLVQEEV